MTTSTKEDFEKWIEELKEQGIDGDEIKEKFLALAFFGKLDILKLFESLGMKNFVDELSFDAVIRGCGSIEFLDWLEENYGSFKNMIEKDSYVPAQQGKLEVLKWMHGHGYEFDETTMKNAVYSDNFKLVEWLCEDVGCKIGQDALKEALIRGHHAIPCYLVKMTSRKTQIRECVKRIVSLLDASDSD